MHRSKSMTVMNIENSFCVTVGEELMSDSKKPTLGEIREQWETLLGEGWKYVRYEECMIPQTVEMTTPTGGTYTICAPVHDTPINEFRMKAVARAPHSVAYLLRLVERMGKEFSNWECPVCDRFLDKPYVDCSFCKPTRALLEELKQ